MCSEYVIVLKSKPHTYTSMTALHIQNHVYVCFPAFLLACGHFRPVGRGG